jgi:hypothetical protein
MNHSAKEGRVCAGGGPRGDLAEERVTSRYNLAKTGCWCLGQARFTIVAAVAQLERDLIRERVSASVRNARACGKELGRPRRIVDHDRLVRMKAEGASLRQIAEALGIGYGTVRTRLQQAS